MRRWHLFLPVAAITLFAGWLGWRIGSDDRLDAAIAAAAERYVAAMAPEAQLAHCRALPADAADAEIVVICDHPSGRVWQAVIGPRGRLLEDGVMRGLSA